jgi:hypothetical protein
MLIRLVTGASWVDIEAILEHQVSDTTLRARLLRVDAGVFESLQAEALAAFDQIVGLDLEDYRAAWTIIRRSSSFSAERATSGNRDVQERCEHNPTFRQSLSDTRVAQHP